MPSIFENGVFTDNEPAWHGAGVVVDDEALTSERVFELVPELASEVVKVPIYAALTNEDESVDVLDTEGYQANVRVLDKRVLGVVGERYHVCQNRDLFAFAETIVDAGGALWKTAGTLKNGAVVWGLLRLPGEITIAHESNEIVVPYLMVTNSFDYTCAVTAVVCWTRVVCWNTWNVALREAPRKFAMRHTQSLEGRLLDARDALGVVYKQGDLIQKLGDELVAEEFRAADFDRFLRKLMPYPEGADERPKAKANVDERRDMLDMTWRSAPNLESIRHTKWGALQAVLEYEQHVQHPERDAQRQLQALALEEPTLAPKAYKLLVAS